ncbi:MAG TPA: VWA domain-containing protein [Edaphobacter sp.]|nr:VWA domain-containing protein [Edaphobacter sp.]
MIVLRSLRPVLLASVLFSPCLLAQQKPSTPDQTPASTAPTIAVDARLVNLPVVVRDKKGALIQNLTKDDFILQVDDKPQTIRYFDKDTNLPLTLGLLVDTSLSQREVIDEERSASSVFLDQMLTTPKDRAFIMQFAAETELLQDLTSSRPLLQAALKEIDTPSKDSGSSNDGSAPRRPRGGGGTVLYDALFLASDELMSKQTGRKALIILSDGGDRGSRENLAKSIEAAQRADTIIYAIYFKGEPPHQDYPHNRGGGGYPGGGGGGYPGGGYPGGGYPGGGYPGGGYPGGGYPGGGYPGGGNGGGNNGGNYPTGSGHIDGKKNLERMAQETGGRFFEVKKNQNVAQIYNEIAEELRAQYRLGYTPTQDAASNGYHRIELTLRQKGLLIQTRDGYYTGK